MTTIITPAGASRPSKHCHRLIASTAMDMASELYEELMKDNEWYRRWKAKNPGASSKALFTRFVNKTWPTLIGDARAMLAQMLARPIDPKLKETIEDALLLDNTLLRGRLPSGQVTGKV
jgi:hypothetical protein